LRTAVRNIIRMIDDKHAIRVHWRFYGLCFTFLWVITIMIHI